MPEFNPLSYDSVLATINAKLDAQDKKFQEKVEEDRRYYAAIMAKQDVTNGRVNRLEEWKSNVRAQTLTITGVGTLLGFLIANSDTISHWFK